MDFLILKLATDDVAWTKYYNAHFRLPTISVAKQRRFLSFFSKVDIPSLTHKISLIQNHSFFHKRNTFKL